MLLRSIANKILLTMVAVILVMSAAFLAYFVAYVTDVMERRADLEGLSKVNNLAQSAELGVITEEGRFLRGPFRGVLSDPAVAYVVAYNGNGRIIGSDAKVTIDPVLPPKILNWMKVAMMPIHVDSPVRGLPDAIDYYAPVVMGAETQDEAVGILDVEEGEVPQRGTMVGLVRVGISGAEIVLARRRVLIYGMTVVLITFIITTVAVIFLAKHFTLPLVRLREGASRIAKGDLNFHIPVGSRDEIGELARSFNVMTAELQNTTVSKNYVDNILGSMVDTLVVIDSNGIIQMVNMAILRLLGQREGELVGKPFTTILRDAAVLNGPAWRRFLESGTLKNFELSYITKRGESVPMNFNGSLMPGEQGGAQSIVGVAHDVREIKRLMADIERRRSETEQARYDAEFQKSRLMFLLSSLNEGVVMFDTRGEIVIINPVARRFFRFGADEEVTREKLKKVSWLRLDNMMSETSADEQSTAVNEAEIDFPVPQVIRTALTEVRAPDGRLIGILMVLQDVTEERHLDRMRDEFVVTVSHDLRTPLTTIKGFVSLLLAEKVGKLTDKQRKFLQYADESAQHLHTLINDLLDLSKIRAGKLVVDIESIDLCKVAEASIRLYKPAADTKGVALNLLTAGDSCIVEADFERMKEALNNLIGNALKFTPQDGEIIIEVLDHPDEGEIRVKDTGSGIAKKDVGVIFEKFRSIPSKGADNMLSTGIGLSIVKGIVLAHQGKVWVESEVDHGSTFFVRVPKKHA